MKSKLTILTLMLAAFAAYADFCPKCGKEVGSDDKFCPACGKALRESADNTQQQQVNVNVNVNVNQLSQSQSYSPTQTAYTEPDEQHGYKVVSSHVYQLRGDAPLFVSLPGVDGGLLCLNMKDMRHTLYGGLGKVGDPDTTRPIVTADQIARDRPALPCLLCEWTYTAVDRDGSQLGILVVMVDPGLLVMRNPVRVMTPAGPQIVEQIQDVKMEPTLKVIIWRKQ